MKKDRLLFIDSDSAVLRRLQHALRNQQRHWDMWFAADLESARALMASQPADAIVLDVELPAGGALRLIKDLRSDPNTMETPVLILARRGLRRLTRRAVKLGATDLLLKPVHRDDLIIRLQSILALKLRQDEIKSLNDALEQKVRQRTAQLERSRLDVIWRLAKVGEYRDEETGYHIIRVGRYCRILGDQLGLTAEAAEELALAAPLHDIGKVGVPDAVLLKPDRLTPAEWTILESHCVIGSEILLQHPKGLTADESDEPGVRPSQDNRVVQLAASIALTHHERWDGRGYPLGLRGDSIPLESRIVAVADVYDALRSVRPYKTEYSHDKTLAIMAEERSRHFDPDVYDAFRMLADEFQAVRMEYADSHPAKADQAEASPPSRPDIDARKRPAQFEINECGDD